MLLPPLLHASFLQQLALKRISAPTEQQPGPWEISSMGPFDCDLIPILTNTLANQHDMKYAANLDLWGITKYANYAWYCKLYRERETGLKCHEILDKMYNTERIDSNVVYSNTIAETVYSNDATHRYHQMHQDAKRGSSSSNTSVEAAQAHMDTVYQNDNSNIDAQEEQRDSTLAEQMPEAEASMENDSTNTPYRGQKRAREPNGPQPPEDDEHLNWLPEPPLRIPLDEWTYDKHNGHKRPLDVHYNSSIDELFWDANSTYKPRDFSDHAYLEQRRQKNWITVSQEMNFFYTEPPSYPDWERYEASNHFNKFGVLHSKEYLQDAHVFGKYARPVPELEYEPGVPWRHKRRYWIIAKWSDIEGWRTQPRDKKKRKAYSKFILRKIRYMCKVEKDASTDIRTVLREIIRGISQDKRIWGTNKFFNEHIFNDLFTKYTKRNADGTTTQHDSHEMQEDSCARWLINTFRRMVTDKPRVKFQVSSAAYPGGPPCLERIRPTAGTTTENILMPLRGAYKLQPGDIGCLFHSTNQHNMQPIYCGQLQANREGKNASYFSCRNPLLVDNIVEWARRITMQDIHLFPAKSLLSYAYAYDKHGDETAILVICVLTAMLIFGVEFWQLNNSAVVTASDLQHGVMKCFLRHDANTPHEMFNGATYFNNFTNHKQTFEYSPDTVIAFAQQGWGHAPEVDEIPKYFSTEDRELARERLEEFYDKPSRVIAQPAVIAPIDEPTTVLQPPQLAPSVDSTSLADDRVLRSNNVTSSSTAPEARLAPVQNSNSEHLYAGGLAFTQADHDNAAKEATAEEDEDKEPGEGRAEKRRKAAEQYVIDKVNRTTMTQEHREFINVFNQDEINRIANYSNKDPATIAASIRTVLEENHFYPHDSQQQWVSATTQAATQTTLIDDADMTELDSSFDPSRDIQMDVEPTSIAPTEEQQIDADQNLAIKIAREQQDSIIFADEQLAATLNTDEQLAAQLQIQEEAAAQIGATLTVVQNQSLPSTATAEQVQQQQQDGRRVRFQDVPEVHEVLDAQQQTLRNRIPQFQSAYIKMGTWQEAARRQLKRKNDVIQFEQANKRLEALGIKDPLEPPPQMEEELWPADVLIETLSKKEIQEQIDAYLKRQRLCTRNAEQPAKQIIYQHVLNFEYKNVEDADRRRAFHAGVLTRDEVRRPLPESLVESMGLAACPPADGREQIFVPVRNSTTNDDMCTEPTSLAERSPLSVPTSPSTANTQLNDIPSYCSAMKLSDTTIDPQRLCDISKWGTRFQASPVTSQRALYDASTSDPEFFNEERHLNIHEEFLIRSGIASALCEQPILRTDATIPEYAAEHAWMQPSTEYIAGQFPFTYVLAERPRSSKQCFLQHLHESYLEEYIQVYQDPDQLEELWYKYNQQRDTDAFYYTYGIWREHLRQNFTTMPQWNEFHAAIKEFWNYAQGLDHYHGQQIIISHFRRWRQDWQRETVT